MAIVPFQIVNPDGTVNQAEYDRCVNFLNDYVAGNIYVYPQLTWSNPLEIDLSQEKSAFSILTETLGLSTNRLLNKLAFDEIKKLFRGVLTRYGSTIYTYGRFLEQSQSFVDGPGYYYDPLTEAETPVLKETISPDITIYYLSDENHTVLEYNDTAYAETNNANLPVSNINLGVANATQLTSNLSNNPAVYNGNLCGVYTPFYRLAGQYVGSSTLFYYSQCNDIMYTTGGSSYYDSRIGQIINFNYDTTVSNKSRPARGVDSSLVITAQNAVVNPELVNAYIPPATVNPNVNYLSPAPTLTAQDTTEWLI